jgi:hypothetical protein
MKLQRTILSKSFCLILSALLTRDADSTDIYTTKTRLLAENAPLATAAFLGFCDTHACRDKTSPQATYHQLPRIAQLCTASVFYNSVFSLGKKIAQGQSRIQRLKNAVKEDFKRESIPQAVLTFSCYIGGKILYYTLGKKLLKLDDAR